MEEGNNNQNIELKRVLNQPYKYGFQTLIEKEEFPKGLNIDIIELI
jgi:hypothetical protein